MFVHAILWRFYANSLECPTMIFGDAIFERDICSGHTAYRPIETISNTPINIPQIELLKAIIQFGVALHILVGVQYISNEYKNFVCKRGMLYKPHGSFQWPLLACTPTDSKSRATLICKILYRLDMLLNREYAQMILLPHVCLCSFQALDDEQLHWFAQPHFPIFSMSKPKKKKKNLNVMNNQQILANQTAHLGQNKKTTFNPLILRCDHKIRTLNMVRLV